MVYQHTFKMRGVRILQIVLFFVALGCLDVDGLPLAFNRSAELEHRDLKDGKPLKNKKFDKDLDRDVVHAMRMVTGAQSFEKNKEENKEMKSKHEEKDLKLGKVFKDPDNEVEKDHKQAITDKKQKKDKKLHDSQHGTLDDKEPEPEKRKKHVKGVPGTDGKLSLKDLELPDHVDGVRMEHDGHLNHEYKKEILLGEEHMEFDSALDSQKIPAILKDIFQKADRHHDGFLDKQDLELWIIDKVKEHLNEATNENNRIFTHLDSDKDGFITWEEFRIHFLLAIGVSQQNIKKYGDNDDELIADINDRERLIRYKYRWAEADEESLDNKLDSNEMKNFRHPEQSPALLKRMARDILDNLDTNEDGVITEAEFVDLARSGVNDLLHEGTQEEKEVMEERKKEFRNVIDLNHDGKASEEELVAYVDPHNAQHAQLEANNLINLADENSDGRLSLEEVINNADIFFGSKLINVAVNFHDEF